MPALLLSIPLLVMAAMANGSSPKGSFGLGFDWGDLELCTSGIPNIVDSPKFMVADVPAGTRFIEFKLIDHDAPGYNHGGGGVSYDGQKMIAAGAFTYKSPCPPNGSHTYEWIATAFDSKNGTQLGQAHATAVYP